MTTADGVDKSHVAYHFENGRIPVIVHVPHASTYFPKDMLEKGVKLNPENNLQDDVEIIADRYMDTVTRRIFAESGLEPYWFESRVSRMFMDPERFKGDDEPMNSVGMGVVYTRNHEGNDIYTVPPTPSQREHRVSQFYDTYSEAFTKAVDHILHRHGKCLILDAHSYASTALPYELNAEEERTPLVLGYDEYHAQGIVGTQVMSIERQYYVSSNTVFKGSYVPLSQLNQNPAVSSVMFEMRKDTYMNEQSGLLLNAQETPLLSAISDDMVSLTKAFC